MTRLVARGLTVRRGDCPVVQDVSVSVGAGEFVGLIGPNGAGKTTFLRGLLGLLPGEGHASLAALPPAERARTAAWLPQGRDIAWPVSVRDIVALGRVPHGRPDPGHPAVAAALARMALEGFRDRTATALSGGEQARVLIARALAQDAPVLMADEPVAGLDPAAQIATMRVFGDLAAEGRIVVAALHDLGLAARHCSRLLVMSQGRIVADGPPRAVLAGGVLRDVFRITAHVADLPDGLIVQPVALAEDAG